MSRKFKMASASRFFCTKCGREGIPIIRKQAQQRKSGHLKKLFCLYCNEEVNHVEVKESGDYTYENFLEEFNTGRFIEGNREEMDNLFSCTKINCEFNKNGKCWNANNSEQCNHKPRKDDKNV